METNITLSQLAKYPIGENGLKVVDNLCVVKVGAQYIDRICANGQIILKTVESENIIHVCGITPIFRPWSHLIEKDENGFCDLDRLADIAECAVDNLRFNGYEFSKLYKGGLGDVNAFHQLQLFDFLFEHRYNVYNVKCIYE